ncbi:MAG: 50S ribosomal protein L23 [Mycoplasmataceae bacterium]|jgi:ribosomal protein L23|nr:50S ribosomal protein L23 [Mycoplasmataceae bacterium]
MLDFTRIILKPYQTEKTYGQKNDPYPKYAFVVDKNATKYDIAIAFETIYGHHPIKVATQIRKAARTRSGTLHPGFTKTMKIAYVSLPSGVSLDPADQKAAKEDVKVQPVNNEYVKKQEVTPSADANANTAAPTATKTEINSGAEGGNS